MLITYFYFPKKIKKVESINIEENTTYNSNIIKDVEYASKDAKGNKYIVNAKEGEIDYSNSSVIFLTKVKAKIELNNKEIIYITSDFGKYNIDNYDTIFSKNVVVDYIENKITSEYLDFSINRNTMIISKNVIYNNLQNLLYADVVEINLETKDTLIFMYESEKKVNIKSID